MKTAIFRSGPRIVRNMNGLLACLSLAAAAPAIAAPYAQVGVVLSTEQFASGVDVDANSEDRLIHKSKSYKYKLTATCKGATGTPVARLFPEGKSLAEFLDELKPGSSKILSGTVDNPTGKLPLTLVDRKFSGSKIIKGFGTVKVSMTIFAEIQSNGRILFQVNDIKFTSVPKQKLGTVKFMKGSKFEVTAAPMFSFLKAAAGANESGGSATVSVSRLVNYVGTYSVDFSTANGTGDSTSHYQTTTGTLTFGDGETKKNIVVPLVDNALSDGPRTFTITLSNPSKGSFVGAIPTATVTIKNND